MNLHITLFRTVATWLAGLMVMAAGCSDFTDNLGGGYFYISESQEATFLIRGEAEGVGVIRTDDILLAMHVTVLNYDNKYIYVEKGRITRDQDFEFAASWLNYSAQQLDSFKLAERNMSCAPCYYIVDKRSGEVGAPLGKAAFERAIADL